MKYTNLSNLPEPYVNAVINDEYNPGDSDYTPSSLIRPPYMAELFRKHGEEIEIDVADRFFALMGKMAHKLLEENDTEKKSLSEIRIYTKVDKWVIGMQFDRLHLDKKTMSLQDWKMTTIYKFKKDYNNTYPDVPEWEIQLNIGAYILRQGGWIIDNQNNRQNFNPLTVDKLEIIGLLRDFKLRDAKLDKLYPQKPVISRQIQIWNDKKTIEYIRNRATEHDNAKVQPDKSLIPPCTEDEMWAKPTTYAILKKGGKRALTGCAKFESKESAIKSMEAKDLDPDKHEIKKRPGLRNRCESYCDVSKFCPAHQKWLKNNG